ncbi:UNVERIFIED_CONTAM: hypothetical protein RMT77_010900 [Armadillidium vulgare]
MACNEKPVCEVCFVEFDETNCIPLVLNCGHSFCRQCIIKTLDNVGSCPKCRRRINQRITELPINYSLIQLGNTCNSPREQKISSDIQRLGKLLSNQTDDISRIISDFSSKLILTRSNLAILNEIKVCEDGERRNYLRKKIDKIEEEYKSIQDNLPGIYSNSIGPSRFPLWNICETEKFFQNIYDMVNRGEDVYTSHEINNEIKYGKISIHKNMILFHCMDLSDIPKYAVVLQFNYLKQFVYLRKLHSFLHITSSEHDTRFVMVEMIKKMGKRRRKINSFIYLCTGEFGISYKSCARQKPSKFKNYILDIKCSEKVINFGSNRIEDYNRCLFTDNYRGSRSEIVFLEYIDDDDNISFRKSADRLHNDYSIGIVISPLVLVELLEHDDLPECNILDCGIAVRVKDEPWL